MNKYQEALDKIGNIVLDEQSDGYETPRCVRDFYYSEYNDLQELIDRFIEESGNGNE